MKVGILKEKDELRQKFKAEIKLLSLEQKLNFSKLIESHLQQLMTSFKIQYPNLKGVGLFVPLEDEPRLDLVSWQQNHLDWEICLPVVLEQTMLFKRFELGDKLDWKGRELSGENVDPDVLVIPGLLFSSEGFRLGRGRGFYDKYLATHEPKIKIGIGFHRFFRQSWKPDQHDQKVDYVVTEKGAYDCRVSGASVSGG